MTDIAYDPALPFVLVNSEGFAVASFAYKSTANVVKNAFFANAAIVDTTPKPKIPTDAQHITWGNGLTAYSRRGGGWVGGARDRRLSEQEMLNYIGDSDVIVLKAVIPNGA